MYSIFSIPKSDFVPPSLLEPHGEDAFVKVEAHRVVLAHHIVEGALHVAVRPDALQNGPAESFSGRELNGLEVIYVAGIEEHVAHNRFFLVDFEGIASQDYLFQDNSARAGFDGCAGAQERKRIIIIEHYIPV